MLTAVLLILAATAAIVLLVSAAVWVLHILRRIDAAWDRDQREGNQ